jgi:hypothetical protein
MRGSGEAQGARSAGRLGEVINALPTGINVSQPNFTDHLGGGQDFSNLSITLPILKAGELPPYAKWVEPGAPEVDESRD